MGLALKSARVGPLLVRKSTLDPDQFKSYCPMSRLPFLSNVTEKAVALCLNSYMHDNDLIEKYQSAYKPFHSTETALVFVANDICYCVEELLDSSHTEYKVGKMILKLCLSEIHKLVKFMATQPAKK